MSQKHCGEYPRVQHDRDGKVEWRTMIALKERLGPALKALRERRSMTQIELAERCHLSRGAIGQFERGEASPAIDTLGRILEVLESDLCDLQRALDGRSEAPTEQGGQFLEIGGVRLGPGEVERRLEEAFDRLVRRSLEGERKKAVVPPPSPTAAEPAPSRRAVGVGDD
jgi:transcriptional regulator with XRE-family HTH domain